MDRAAMRPAASVAVRALAALLIVVAAPPLAGAPRPAHAEDAGARVRERLRTGRKLYEEQEYRKAVRELAPVARDPAATRAQKLEALELLGLCWFILGHEDKAREAFEDLLAIDPGYTLREPSGSPKIRRFFEEVRRAYVPDAAGGQAALEHAAPTDAVAGRKVEFAAEITAGQDVVKEIVVRWRRRGVLEYRDAPMRRAADGRFRARFTPPADRAGYVLEYYLEARDIAGRSVARVGGPETPLALSLRGAPPEGTAWYRRWYVWAGAGVIVLGTAAAITAAATADEAPDGTLGTVELP